MHKPKSNRDVREAVKAAGITLWEVAEMLDMADSNFSRLLRRELTYDQKKDIFKVVERLKKERGICND